MVLPRSLQELIPAIRCLVRIEFTNYLPLRYHESAFTFVAQAASVCISRQDLHENLAYFKVPPPGIESITSIQLLKYLTNFIVCKHPERYVQYEIQRASQRQCSDGLRPKRANAPQRPSSTPPSKLGIVTTLGVPRRRRRRRMDTNYMNSHIIDINYKQQEATHRSPPDPHLQRN